MIFFFFGFVTFNTIDCSLKATDASYILNALRRKPSPSLSCISFEGLLHDLSCFFKNTLLIPRLFKQTTHSRRVTLSCFALPHLRSWKHHKVRWLILCFPVISFLTNKKTNSEEREKQRRRKWRGRFCCFSLGASTRIVPYHCWDKHQTLSRSSGQWHNKTGSLPSKTCHTFFNSCQTPFLIIQYHMYVQNKEWGANEKKKGKEKDSGVDNGLFSWNEGFKEKDNSFLSHWVPERLFFFSCCFSLETKNHSRDRWVTQEKQKGQRTLGMRAQPHSQATVQHRATFVIFLTHFFFWLATLAHEVHHML